MARAGNDRLIANHNSVQLVNPIQIEKSCRLQTTFVKLDTQVGCAGDDPSGWMRLQDLGRCPQRGRAEDLAGSKGVICRNRNGDVLVSVRSELLEESCWRINLVHLRAARDVSLKGRFHDRGVACAATQVARQAVANFLDRELVGLLEHSGHRHYKSRRAKTALRAVTVNHRTLDSIELASCVAQSLYRDDMLAIQLKDETNTGVDGTIFKSRRRTAWGTIFLSVPLRSISCDWESAQDRAGTAIAFTADNLRAAKTQSQPQIIR